MKFKISGIPYNYTDEKIENDVITIYVIGSLEINTTLESEYNYTKHKNFNAYLIKISELNKKYEFFININGTSGDLINIGSHFHDGTSDSLSHRIINGKMGSPVYGYLKNEIKSKNCRWYILFYVF